MRRLLAIVLTMSLASPIWGVVALNNAGTMTNTSGSGTSSGAFSVTAGGSNLAAIACVATDRFTTETGVTVTYGGISMTSAGSPANNTTSNSFTQLFYLAAPPTGSNTLVVTVANSGTTGADIYVNLVSFTGVNQTTPVRAGTNGTAATASANPQLVVTSNVNDLTITCLDSGGPAMTSTNQTSDGINNGGAFSGGSDHATTAAASVTHTWTLSGSGNYALSGFSIDGDSNVSASAPAYRGLKISGGKTSITGGKVSVR